MNAESKKISIVIPVYNEAESVPHLLQRLSTVMAKPGFDYEIILVDDGSTDETAAVLKSSADRDEHVHALILSRNFGHQLALTAGLDHSRGDAVIVMDGDLQHPPELLPALIEKWQQGYDIVYTIREATLDAGWLKKWTSQSFYRLINALSTVPIQQNAADFRLMDRRAVDVLQSLRERFRFIRGMVSWIGFRQTAVRFQAEQRFAGESKYSFKKMVAFAIDAVVSFSALPLRLTFYLGFITSLLSFIYLLYTLYIKFFTRSALQGWTSLMVLILFLGGIQLIIMGIIGEYLGRIYEEVKNRPLYVVKNHYGSESNKGSTL